MSVTLDYLRTFYPEKVIETLPSEKKLSIITNTDYTPKTLLFTTLLNANIEIPPTMWKYAEYEYYITKVPSRTISPYYNVFSDIYLSEYLSDITQAIAESSVQSAIDEANEQIATNVIIPKYAKKWEELYDLLYNEEYSPLDDYSETETRKGEDTDTKTYDISDGKTATNTDTTTRNVQTDESGKVGTKETTTRSTESANDIYGFNSSLPVGDNTSNSTVSESVVGDADSNTSERTQTQQGTESKAIGINETLKKTGTETTEYGKNETVTRTGRREAGSTLIEKEISFRSRNILINVIVDDIISETTIQIY